MKKLLLICITCACACIAYASVTTYTFTSVNWDSKVGATVCDKTTDGWICDLAAYEVGTARYDAQNRLMYAGVGVKTSTSGAGATSVVSFTNVRSIEVNFCQNSSKGRGVLYVQVGDAPYDSLIIRKPATSGAGVYNRDSVLQLSAPCSGKVRFWINCSENGIYLNTLTIRAEEGGSSPFTQDRYVLVTDAAQLQDSDQIIIGVPGANRIMGYFDESVSQNNIHSIRGRFAADGTEVEANDEAIYTLHTATLPGIGDCYYIQDEIRYEEAYLVASGGQTKNRLALWTHLYDEKTYGNYGYWTISVTPTGEATICNLGNSLGKYLQYNAINNPTLFGCYQQQGMQTAVSIYRRVNMAADEPAIVAPLVNFGTAVLSGGQTVSASRTIEVNANMLTEDITLTLAPDDKTLPVPFTLSPATSIDRDGGKLTIDYSVSTAGTYNATLYMQSGSVIDSTRILLKAVAEMTIAEAVQQSDYTFVYLNPVTVTKKFDTYIFIEDETGAMLIYDNGDGESGKRYGTGLKNGDRLSGVVGRFQNYYGVPELVPTAAFSTTTGATLLPTVCTAIDSADVCRYVRLEHVCLTEEFAFAGQQAYPVVDAFNTGIQPSQDCTVDAIVMISWDEVQLWIVHQEETPTAIEETDADGTTNSYTLLGVPTPDYYRGVRIENGKLKLR